MRTYAFDLEIFPNFFSAIFVNVEDEFDEEVFIIYEEQNDLHLIREFINHKITLVGYNNLYFDNVLLNAILEHKENLFEIAQDIINLSEKKPDDLTLAEKKRVEIVSKLRNKRVPYRSIDIKELEKWF